MGESVAFAQPAGVSGVVSMRVLHSPQLWKVLHHTYTICNTLPSLGRGAEWIYRGKTYNAHAQMSLFMEPGETHCNVRIDGPLSFETVTIPPSVLCELTRELGARGEPHFRTAQTTEPAVYVAFQAFLDSIRVPATTPLEQQTRLADCVRLLHTCHMEENVTSRDCSEKAAVRRIRDYLADRISEAVSLDDLVELTGISRFHLVREFRKHVGVPPHEYHLMLRVARACQLLENGEPPASVAMTLGFADQSHFGRTFRRMWRVSPGVYRASTGGRAIAF